MPEVFVVDPRPDGGEFSGGSGGALAWDVLARTGSHRVPDIIDLRALVHLKPYAIACLCGLAELARANGQSIGVVPPQSTECANHLARLGMPDFFEGTWSSIESRATNREVRRVEWPPGSSAEDIVSLLAPSETLGVGVFPRMAAAVDEIIRNALTHAGSPIDCVVTGQRFPGTAKTEIAVLDLGCSIRTHLSRNPKYASLTDSDEAAIRLAMQDGVTGTVDGGLNSRGEPNSGAGLAELRAYCESGGGELTILSGDVWITCQPHSPPVIGSLYGGFQGCLVNVRFFEDLGLPEEEQPIL